MTTADNRAASRHIELRHARGLVGVFNLLPSCYVVEASCRAGFDVVVFDLEHGPDSPATVADRHRTTTAAGRFGMVRVAGTSPSAIGGALDTGVDGIVVPGITGLDDAVAVAAARFHPHGRRGANPWVRAAGFGDDAAFFSERGNRPLVLVMVEGVNALDDLGDILCVPGLDGIFLGPVDLSHALGVPGEVDHPTVVERIDAAISASIAADRFVGVFASTARTAGRWLSAGASLVVLGVDAAWVMQGMRAPLIELQSSSGRSY